MAPFELIARPKTSRELKIPQPNAEGREYKQIFVKDQ